jgi:hypothetical protein
VSRIVGFAAVIVTALVFAGDALACVCADAPIAERLDSSDAALVGRIVSEGEESVGGITQRVLTVEVDQRVKGDISRELSIRSPLGTDCDVLAKRDQAVGLLLTRSVDGAWFASACSVVAPGVLVAAGGEPRGGVIKVVVGFFILGLVLLWAFRRLRRGARPDLPGAPDP